MGSVMSNEKKVGVAHTVVSKDAAQKEASPLIKGLNIIINSLQKAGYKDDSKEIKAIKALIEKHKQ